MLGVQPDNSLRDSLKDIFNHGAYNFGQLRYILVVVSSTDRIIISVRFENIFTMDREEDQAWDCRRKGSNTSIHFMRRRA